MTRDKETLFPLIVENSRQISDGEPDKKTTKENLIKEKHVEMFDEKSKRRLLEQIENLRLKE